MWRDAVQRLEAIARRAPSPHNTQPWRLLCGADRLHLAYEPARILPHSDPHRRDLLLSLGCFVEALLIAAADAGIGLDFTPDIDVAGDNVGTFHPAERYLTRFTAHDVLHRQTSRLAYLDAVPDAALWSAAQGCLSARERVVRLGFADIRGLLRPADRHFLETPEIVREFRRWARLTPAEMAANEDGLSADCLGLSAAQAGVLAFLLSDPVYPWFRRSRLSAVLSQIAARTIGRDAHLLALVGHAVDPAGVLLAGRSLMRLWLTLDQAGYYAQPLSQLLDCPTSLRNLSQRAGLADGETMLCILRFGASRRPALSRRQGCADPLT